MTYSSPFGLVLGRKDVQAAVISALQAWIVPCLAEVERQEGLPARTIPAPGNTAYPPVNQAAFRGGLDFERYQGDELPLLIVVAQPTGDADRWDDGVYQQWFEVQIAAVVEDIDQEQLSEQLADWYGKALTLFVQQGAFGTRTDPLEGVIPFAIKTMLMTAPRTEFVAPLDRKLARTVLVLHTLIPVVDEGIGPRVPPADPYAVPGALPTVTSVDVQLSSEDPLGNLAPATGKTVTSSTGHVVVSE